MKIYFILIFFHLFGDVILQRSLFIRKIFKCRDFGILKRQNVKFIVIHVILYTLSVSLAFLYLKLFTVYNIFIVFISHFIIDYIKCYKISYIHKSLKYYVVNLIDQLLHISILVLIASLYSGHLS